MINTNSFFHVRGKERRIALAGNHSTNPGEVKNLPFSVVPYEEGEVKAQSINPNPNPACISLRLIKIVVSISLLQL